MFGKKYIPPGRQRPQTTNERRNAAVFSYSGAARTARPGAGNTGRDVQAQQSGQGAAEQRRVAHSHWLRRRSAMAALCLAGIVLLVSLFLGSQPRFEYSGDSMVALRSEAVYAQAAAALLKQSPLNRTKLTVNTRHIARELQSQFPELGSVSVVLPVFGRQPVVKAEPPTPALIISEGGQSYILDTTGRALMTPAEARNTSKLTLPVVTDQSGLPVHIGRVALPGSTTRFITEVAGQMRAAKLTMSSLTLPKGTSELDLRLEGQPYYVKFNLMGNAREEAGAFLAVKQQLEREHKTAAAYIDVRVEGRAYYK